MNEPYIQALREAIQKMHGCGSCYVQTVAVKEEVKGQTVWEGKVEIFDLAGHGQARQCFAWRYKEEGGKWQYAGILNPPVKSALEAVRVFLGEQGKKSAPV